MNFMTFDDTSAATVIQIGQYSLDQPFIFIVLMHVFTVCHFVFWGRWFTWAMSVFGNDLSC